jgi:hypothetical protein
MANWLNKYEQGGLVLKKKTKDNFDLKVNPNDVQASVGPGFVGDGYDTTGRNYSPAWGGQFAVGGSLPGSVGFTYARVAGSAPANGKYTKKTKASAQNGKKLYGATDAEEKSVIDFAKNYYASDRFKENLYDKGNAGIKNKSAQVSKDAIDKINSLSYTYKPLNETGFDKGNVINMGNPNAYLNAPKDLVFAHEMFHPMETEILSSQPRNVMTMLNRNTLKNRKGDANALYQDMLSPVPTNIDGTFQYPSVGDWRQSKIKEFASNDQDLSNTSMHDDLVGEVRSDIMALRYLANKKGIWDVTKSGVKDMTPEMLNELYKSPELNKQMYKSDSSGKTNYLPSEKAKAPGNLKGVEAPKNPGLMLDRLKQRYSDKDLLYLMNKLAYENNNQDQTIAQNGKEMAFYQNGLDFKPKTISQNGVKTGKKSKSEVSPYTTVDAGIANVLRGIIPAPLNVSQALAKTVAGDARLNETSLSDDQKLVLWNTIQNARKRSGKQTGGGTEYSDYGDQGYGKGEDFDNWFNRGKIGALSGIYNSLTNPGFVMASTVGRGRYWTDPNNPDDINYTDVYDWNTSEKNYKGGNAYQKIRNLVRANEDKSLNKTKNDKTRMNIHLTKKEIDAIKERKEMKLSSLIAFDKGGVIKDDMGQWAHPGEITEIGSNNITMQGVDYPVLGISDTGDTQMMYPGEDYNFDGEKVTEFPMMKKGGWLNKYK